MKLRTFIKTLKNKLQSNDINITKHEVKRIENLDSYQLGGIALLAECLEQLEVWLVTDGLVLPERDVTALDIVDWVEHHTDKNNDWLIR